MRNKSKLLVLAALCVTSLLGCDRATQDDYGLVIAAGSGDLPAMRLLLGRGARPNMHLGEGGTALGRSVAYGHLEAVKLLLENGADINFMEGHMTPLDRAISRGRAEIAMYLISHGGRIEATKTPSEPARMNLNLPEFHEIRERLKDQIKQ